MTRNPIAKDVVCSFVSVYFLCFWFFSVRMDHAFPTFSAFLDAYPFYPTILTLTCLLPLTLALYIAFWSMDQWSNHPMVKKIMPYATEGLWKDVVKVLSLKSSRL